MTVSGTISDPGWLDPLSGDDLVGRRQRRPDARRHASRTTARTRRSRSASTHVYGDNGMFTAQICAADDDTNPCTTFPLQITTRRRRPSIDLSGAVDVNGTPTVIAHAGRLGGLQRPRDRPGQRRPDAGMEVGRRDAGRIEDLISSTRRTPIQRSARASSRATSSSGRPTRSAARARTRRRFAVGDDDGGIGLAARRP